MIGSDRHQLPRFEHLANQQSSLVATRFLRTEFSNWRAFFNNYLMAFWYTEEVR